MITRLMEIIILFFCILLVKEPINHLIKEPINYGNSSHNTFFYKNV